MGITKLSMNRVIWDQFGVMRQERLLPEQQELLHNKSQQNTRWKLIASYFCHQGLLHKVEATPKISGLHEDIRWRVPQPLWLLSIFIQGRVDPDWFDWWMCVCWPEHLSQQRCGAAAFFAEEDVLHFSNYCSQIRPGSHPSLTSIYTHITSYNLLTWHVNLNHWFSVHREFWVYSFSFFFNQGKKQTSTF